MARFIDMTNSQRITVTIKEFERNFPQMLSVKIDDLRVEWKAAKTEASRNYIAKIGADYQAAYVRVFGERY